jgi:hypothetical protein
MLFMLFILFVLFVGFAELSSVIVLSIHDQHLSSTDQFTIAIVVRVGKDESGDLSIQGLSRLGL